MKSSEIVISVFGSAFKIVFAVILVMLVYKGSLNAYEYGQRVFNEPAVSTGSGRSVRITIPEGSSAKAIGTELEKKGVIRDAQLFVIQEKLSEYKGKLRAGTYELSTAMTPNEMLKILAEGPGEIEGLSETEPE